MTQNFYVQQVCENGHKITGQHPPIIPRDEQKFCRKCGANTIIACTNCDEKIQGDRFERRRSRLELVESPDVPSYCPKCGKPFP